MEKSNSLELILGEKLTKEIYNKLGAYRYSKIDRENAIAIAKELKERGLDLEIPKNNINILTLCKAKEIKEIIKVLEEEGIGKEIIKRSGSIFVQEKASKIRKKINYMKLRKIDEEYASKRKMQMYSLNKNTENLKINDIEKEGKILKRMMEKDIER